jgi:hypothetical protein
MPNFFLSSLLSLRYISCVGVQHSISKPENAMICGDADFVPFLMKFGTRSTFEVPNATIED